MNEIFADVPEALSNTVDICDQVEQCSVTGKNILPISVDETVTEKLYRKNY